MDDLRKKGNIMETTIYGACFSCTSGKSRAVQVLVRLVNNETLGKVIQLDGGVTGYESFCLEGKSAVDIDRMKSIGWWACAGTPGRWDALYFHGLQMSKLFEEFNIK